MKRKDGKVSNFIYKNLKLFFKETILSFKDKVLKDKDKELSVLQVNGKLV